MYVLNMKKYKKQQQQQPQNLKNMVRNVSSIDSSYNLKTTAIIVDWNTQQIVHLIAEK